MKLSKEQKLLSKYLPVSAALISIFISTTFGPDPVNMPKLTLLTISAMFVFGLTASNLKNIKANDKVLFVVISFFTLGLIISLLAGKSRFLTNFYGGMSRNTGFLTYLMLLFFLIGIYQSANIRIIYNLVYALFFTGIFNLVYGFYFLFTGNEIINWKNRYGKFLGTVGNPDFASALLGIAFAGCLAIIGYDGFKRSLRFIAASALLPIVIVTKSTGALQGLVIIGLVTGLFVSFRIWQRYQNSFVSFALIGMGLFSSLLAILGTFQIGPLQSFLYKPSVSIRGAYWRAGWSMFESSPFFGIGLDSYGEYYRKVRDARAVVVPGMDVVTDSAHNVFLDILAGGGLLLFIPYISLIGIIFYKSYQLIIVRKFEPNLTFGLLIIWIAYIAQSIISINQIGLAIWGWVFGGAILLVDKFSKLYPQNMQNLEFKNQNLAPGKFISVVLSTALGVLIVLPVQLSDAKWVSALNSRSIEKLMVAADNWPRTCGKYLLTYNVFSGTSYVTQARSVLEKCLDVEPDNFNANYLFAQFVTAEPDKLVLKKKLQTLDPLNQNFE